MDSAILNLDKNQDELRIFHLISRFKREHFPLNSENAFI